MKNCLAILCVLLSSVLYATAQTPAPTPVNRQPPRSDQVRREAARETDAAFRQLQEMDIPQYKVSPHAGILSEKLQAIYRKPSKEETRILAPSPLVIDRYENFLRLSDTGIFKLNADSRCAGSARVVAALENCLRYQIPGAGTAYSFRVESYRVPHLADLILADNVLKTDGVLQHGIIVNIGDVPLEEVTLQTKGLKFLNDFTPAKDEADMRAIDRRLTEGVKADGFNYRLGFYVDDKTTFVLRSIAYKSKMMRSVDGIVYDEFLFDKRRDVTVAFRVVDKDAGGNITILWKELSSRSAPGIKLAKDSK